MTVTLLVMTHGRRDYLRRTLESFDRMVKGPVKRRVIHDDSADPEFKSWLSRSFPSFLLVSTGPVRIGAGPSVANAWNYLARRGGPEWVFHLEEDFTFNKPVDLADLIALSEAYPYLAQVSLRRQPWGTEVPFGGFEYQAADQYHERADDEHGSWLETTRNFTLNPTLYRRRLCEVGWPTGADSEGHIGWKLREQGLPWGVPGEAVRFGYWGSWDEGRRWVEHIGSDRAGGHGY